MKRQKLTHIQHVFFDLDHTLWDFDYNSACVFEQIFEERGIPISVNEFIKVYAPINVAYWKQFEKGEIDKQNLRYRRLADTFDKLLLKFSRDEIDTISNAYIAYLPLQKNLIEGALATVSYMKTKYKLHIITNGFEEVQEQKLERSGLLSYFDTITNSDEAGVKKPDPYIFRLALSKAGARAEESVMIGDSLEADVMGAQRVGIQGVYFGNELENESMCLNVNKLHQLKELL